MILVDSSVWIDYFRDSETAQTAFLESLLGKESIVIGDLILAEVLQGIASDRDFALTGRRLAALPVICIGGRSVAVQAARNYRLLRTRGIAVSGTIDCMIATRCIVDNLVLLYGDGDFDPFVRHLGMKSALKRI